MSSLPRPQITELASGGQSGVDRAALDWAATVGVVYGGWCPKGGWAEDLSAPPGLLERYDRLRETPSPDPAVRTRWNVRGSDLTLVVCPAAGASPGTDLTVAEARRLGRPCIVSDGDVAAAVEGVRAALDECVTSDGAAAGLTLNVAGPRASEWPEGYAVTEAALDSLLAAGLVRAGRTR